MRPDKPKSRGSGLELAARLGTTCGSAAEGATDGGARGSAGAVVTRGREES